MANTGNIGNGATLGMGAIDGSSYTDQTSIGNITSLGLPDMSVDDIDISSMGEATTTQFRSFIAGLIDAGEMSIEVNFERANYDNCLTLLGDDDAKGIQITLPVEEYGSSSATTATLTFSGYIKSIGGGAPQGDVITAPVTLKAAGEPTYVGS